MQQLCAQLATMMAHNTPVLPWLCIPEMDKALQKNRLASWMRIAPANLGAYVAFTASAWVKLNAPQNSHC